MKGKTIVLAVLIGLFGFCTVSDARTAKIKLTRTELRDKIMGGWAGQTFGCTYGAPTEFKYNGMMIPGDVQVPWDGEHRCKWYFDNEPGLYDDVYMDLSFLDVLDREGMDVPASIYADSFAHASYNLWHANQAARYNILAGMSVPECGYWTNNPHADDIDFQIEADFAGLTSPALPDVAMKICDKVGHIMNYGDGYYGGLYIATMYSLAFVYDDIQAIVSEALKAIPEQSDYHKCISDVIRWCGENADWQDTWKMVEDKWSAEISCPKGVDDPFDIDAKVNSAYVVMGLLYGQKDMFKTMDIAMRCGADSDCNPASAAGILGTVLGYSNIAERWIAPVEEVENINFPHTEISLRKAYDMTERIALENISKAGGRYGRKTVKVPVAQVAVAPFEKSFEGLRLVAKDKTKCNNFRKTFVYEFDGCGIAVPGKLNRKKDGGVPADYVAEVTVSVDGNVEQVLMPSDFATRRFDIYWNYLLDSGHHTLEITWTNPVPGANLVMDSIVIYEKSEK
ncbi:MAG: ADP-ribosylglycohydrolase family protein [Bacteroidales bacterium]|nr:ADP-ribosylglycohydrolase family protein [Candidatus Cryptobacteroides aphodequi]